MLTIQGAPKWLSSTVAAITTIAVVLVPTLVDNHVISTQWGAVIGAIVASVAGSHHATAIATTAAAGKQPPTT